ncbi:hypothetical protein WJX72_003625 [[Myrmecia] bisecta]|uniref:LIM zinc-binding domain-containing protein n=1 Tax=[Myrmecia] bisecta TaxID=41462 RepID=A0AAW1PFB1_9CHLO
MGANHSSARGTFGNGGQYQQPVVYAGGAQAQGQRSFQAHQSTFLGREEDAQEDEELQIALALSASEAQNRGWTRPGEASGSHAGEASTSGSRLAPSTSQDEEFARRLQQEEPSAAEPHVTPHVTGPSSATVPSSPAGSVIGPSEPKRAAWAGNWSDSCAGCGQKLSVLGVPVTSFIEALGKKWHPGCLRCGGCQAPIAGGMFVIGKEDNQGYHPECYKHKFHPRCAVCSDFMPVEADGRIVYCENGFWRDRWCRRHQADGTPRCTSCARMRPAGEQWVPLEDGRELCLACIETIIMDTAGCQPLYNEILQFYDQMGMRLPEKPPLMLVDGTALNEAENKEGREAGSGSAPVFHTRGLTLTVEYRAIRTVAKGHGGPFSIIPHMVNLPGRSHTEVTAILVLYGLPRLLTGSILAHELMHAWLRLNGISGLSLDVEEGLCQLMALLWLESQDLSQKQGTWEERLASFFAHQIRTDTSPIYGDGFRGALDAFQKHGLPDTLACVRRTGTLPV